MISNLQLTIQDPLDGIPGFYTLSGISQAEFLQIMLAMDSALFSAKTILDLTDAQINQMLEANQLEKVLTGDGLRETIEEGEEYISYLSKEFRINGYSSALRDLSPKEIHYMKEVIWLSVVESSFLAKTNCQNPEQKHSNPSIAYKQFLIEQMDFILLTFILKQL